jgi:hypothetical protein
MSRVRASLEIARPVEVVFDAVERPHRIDWHSVMDGATVDGHVQCDPTPSGTRFSWVWEVTLTGPARFTGPLISVVGRRQERTIWNALTRYLEGTGKGSGLDRGTRP